MLTAGKSPHSICLQPPGPGSGGSMPLPPALPAACHQNPAHLHRAPSSASSLFPASERPPSLASPGALQPAKPILGPPQLPMQFVFIPKLHHLATWLGHQEEASGNQIGIMGLSPPTWHLPKAPGQEGQPQGLGPDSQQLKKVVRHEDPVAWRRAELVWPRVFICGCAAPVHHCLVCRK